MLTLHKRSKDQQAFGRNYAYKNVFINNYQSKFGEFVQVKLIKIDGFNLFGDLT